MRIHFNQLFTVIFLLLFGSAFAQSQHSVDSIIALADQAKPADRVGYYLNIADLYLDDKPELALKYSKEALGLAQGLDKKNLISESSSKIGRVYLQMKNFDFAEKYFQQALDLCLSNKDKKGIAKNYQYLGLVCTNTGNLEKAKEFYSQALNSAQNTKDTAQMVASTISIGNSWIKIGDYLEAFNFFNMALVYTEGRKDSYDEKARIYNNLGVLFSEQGNYTKSLEYYEHAAVIYDSLNIQSELGRTYNNIGTIYWYTDDYETAQSYYEKSLRIRHIENDTTGEAYVLNNLGMLVGSKEDFVLALDFFEKSLKLFESQQNRSGCLLATFNLGEVYFAMNEPIKAEDYYNRSLSIAQKDDILDYKLANLESLASLYKRNKNYKKAIEVFDQYVALNDSLEKHSNINKLIEMEASFDQEKKKTSLTYLQLRVDYEKQKAKNIRLAITLVFLFFLSSIIGIFFIFRKQKLRASWQKYQLSQQFLQYQMNPGFLHQSLNYIRNFLYKNKPKEAGAYLSKFSRIIRTFIEHSTSEQISLEKEIETIKQYFKLRQMGYESLFSYQIQIDKNLEMEFIQLPPFLLFPFIDVLLGRFGVKDSLFINLHLKEEQDHLSYNVTIDFLGSHFLDIEDVSQTLMNIAEVAKNRIGLIYKLTRKKIVLNYNLDTVKESKKLHLHLRIPLNN